MKGVGEVKELNILRHRTMPNVVAISIEYHTGKQSYIVRIYKRDKKDGSRWRVDEDHEFSCEREGYQCFGFYRGVYIGSGYMTTCILKLKPNGKHYALCCPAYFN